LAFHAPDAGGGVSAFIEKLLALRIWPLMVKELSQLKRNRRLVISLLIPPTVQVVLAGFALNTEVTQLRLGVLDESRTFESRELITAFSASRAFRVTDYYASPEELGQAVSSGDLDAALTVPSDFARRRLRNQTAEIQVLIDAVNSNTAAIASAYVSQIVRSINQTEKGGGLSSRPVSIQPTSASPHADARQALRAETISITSQPAATADANGPPDIHSRIQTYIALVFNPGLEHSWFVITGILGTIVVLNGSTVASASIIKEREVGTIEQLIMTPASAGEIIIAKVAALITLLLGQLTLALVVGRLIFDIPVRGSMVLLLLSGILCMSVGIGLGLAIAALTHNQQQAQLLGFFINPVVGLLSGALTPIEALPKWMQTASNLNPVRHFAIITRGILIKGVGLSELYPNFLALFGLMVFLLMISTWRLRKHIN
jgi:ABC-2 type transport system permease protein